MALGTFHLPVSSFKKKNGLNVSTPNPKNRNFVTLKPANFFEKSTFNYMHRICMQNFTLAEVQF